MKKRLGRKMAVVVISTLLALQLVPMQATAARATDDPLTKHAAKQRI